MGRYVVALFSVLVLLSVGSSAAGAAPTPTLGRAWAPGVQGYGSVEPATINNNGDVTSFVDDIAWTDWGQAYAVGYGKAYWIWPGQSDAGGAILSRATVVAWDLGTCGGAPSYNKVTWYFPGRGDTFDPRFFRNTCTGNASAYSPPSVACGSVALPHGVAHQIVAYGLGCRRARGIVSRAPAVAHRNGSRFRSGRFYCAAQSAGSPTFWCGRGEAQVSFNVDALETAPALTHRPAFAP